MPQPKRIDIKEFRKKGYLQELNRRFLHPLGLALEVIVETGENGKEVLGGVWDYRDDPEGMHFGIKDRPEDQQKEFKARHDAIKSELKKKLDKRKELLGFEIEPMPSETE